MNDPIVEEVRRVRDALAARFNYDLEAIFRHIKEQEEEEKKRGRIFVSFAPPRIEPSQPPTQPTAPALPTAPTETAAEH